MSTIFKLIGVAVVLSAVPLTFGAVSEISASVRSDQLLFSSAVMPPADVVSSKSKCSSVGCATENEKAYKTQEPQQDGEKECGSVGCLVPVLGQRVDHHKNAADRAMELKCGNLGY